MEIHHVAFDIRFDAVHAPPESRRTQAKFHLGDLRYAVVEMVDGKNTLGLWRYEREPICDTATNGDDDNELRTEEGIRLTFEQYRELQCKKPAIVWVNAFVSRGISLFHWQLIEGIINI
ncbi:hypothetical protein Bbelb_292560 [Branchiostoma belcheri]|nr:hypothetical protein Bbelb_292560 [Branchiostoma belcheri]